MNIQNMLGELLGQAQTHLASGGEAAKQAVQPAAPGGGYSGKQMAGGMAASGVLGLLMGNKKARKKLKKMGGGVVGYGGAAALGAAAHAAYQNWQNQQASPPAAPAQTAEQVLLAPPDARSQPFQLTVIKAMIVAANADGHIDADERASIRNALEQMPVEADHKALMLDTMFDPPSIRQLAEGAQDMEQAAALYLASRVAIDPDHPAERAHLDNLAAALAMPDDLVRQLEEQAAGAEDAPRSPPPPSGGKHGVTR